MTSGDADPILKVCACGRSFTRSTWSALPFVGTADNGRERGELLELRNCLCGSTISIAIGEHAPSSPEATAPDDA